ncbi:hypothetical protein C3488_35950 [Streptomyces sp. Ru72]|nr:hypothetical protein C3488_35950 [Streptomyces sp. Ru72]
MWCAFLHADPGLSSAADRLDPPGLMERAGHGLSRVRSCLADGRRLGGAPGATWVVFAGRS